LNLRTEKEEKTFFFSFERDLPGYVSFDTHGHFINNFYYRLSCTFISSFSLHTIIHMVSILRYNFIVLQFIAFTFAIIAISTW